MDNNVKNKSYYCFENKNRYKCGFKKYFLAIEHLYEKSLIKFLRTLHHKNVKLR